MRLASGMEARVSEVTDDWITIDANHELAGKTLHYDVELLQLTKACCLCCGCTSDFLKHSGEIHRFPTTFPGQGERKTADRQTPAVFRPRADARLQ